MSSPNDYTLPGIIVAAFCSVLTLITAEWLVALVPAIGGLIAAGMAAFSKYHQIRQNSLLFKRRLAMIEKMEARLEALPDEKYVDAATDLLEKLHHITDPLVGHETE